MKIYEKIAETAGAMPRLFEIKVFFL